MNKMIHETHKHALKKFFFVLGIFLAYFLFIVFKFGVKDGIFVSVLTWSFFVLCTPIADAGFLLDFPLRLVLRIRMLYAEIFIWIFAIALNIVSYSFFSGIYDKTGVLKFFKHILQEPFLMWVIVFLSGLGTFLSIQFGDELMDVMRHSQRKYHKKHNVKHRMILIASVFVLTLIVYNFLLKEMGVEIL